MKYFKISAILGSIALICAALIASVNLLTSKKIEQNAIIKELEACQAIYEDYDADKSIELEIPEIKDKKKAHIAKKVEAKDASGNTLGILYTVKGGNAYGNISLIVAITNETVYQVEFLENGQSFSEVLDNHVKAKYPSSESNKVVYDPYGGNTKPGKVDALDSDALNGLDTKCGATYGANTVKELVTLALNDAKGVK